MNLDKRLKRIEDKKTVSKFLPVLILDDEGEIKNCQHLIGPQTVIFIDDIPGDEYVQ